MLAIIKKELKSYLLTPIGYIFIGLFLLMFSLLFYISIYYYRSVYFEYAFYNAATIMTFLIPVLKIRMLSEERKTGTEPRATQYSFRFSSKEKSLDLFQRFLSITPADGDLFTACEHQFDG